MASDANSIIYRQLTDRRERLSAVLPESGESATHLNHLLQEVDAALERFEHGTFGICETCHDSIEADRLLADPLMRFCLDHLNPAQQQSLQEDLDLAARIQTGLLPKQNLTSLGWRASYRYRAAGPVSGDYCDLVAGEDGALYFMLGDVSGKGIAASMLMAHLHAMFRTLISLQLPFHQLMARASRVFCESTLPTHYATLVCGRALRNGEIELCNAGHVPPLIIQEEKVARVEATGLPVGLFNNQEFAVSRLALVEGSTMLLYTDGLPEARNSQETEYGIPRLLDWARCHRALSPSDLVESLDKELRAFQAGAPASDDLSIMAIQRAVPGYTVPCEGTV
jgi:sigma-B regulation protein RsbU (phosphoserine phosphatase)